LHSSAIASSSSVKNCGTRMWISLSILSLRNEK
jgi:hypothetical protein